MVLWESVGYLADDGRRMRAFADLRDRIGRAPDHILAASPETLRQITGAGIMADRQAEKLLRCAQIALEELGGDTDSIRELSAEEAFKLLRRFPGIGEPGAEKIMLFSRMKAVLALESNGLRVLIRLRFGEESKSYAATYRSAQKAAVSEMPSDFANLIRAHQLLRRHGQEICRRTTPLCPDCALSKDCKYYRRYKSNRS